MTNLFESYLQKHALYPAQIKSPPKDNLGIVVVIPAYREESLLPSLQSLADTNPPEKRVEVIVVFNASSKSEKAIISVNRASADALRRWESGQRSLHFDIHILENNQLPDKHAGVGLARKTGMDEAIRRLKKAHCDEGVVVCFDADSRCRANYFVEIEKYFNMHQKKKAISIYFEHPLHGNIQTKEVYRGIAWYELHLRYYKLGLAYAGMPFAFHCIGSSMAVRAVDYCRQGGMNKRKAGEDFYFLQKFIDLNQLGELKSTTVFPSARPSDRVPFGTGRAVVEMLNGQRKIDFSYSFKSFEILRESLINVSQWYDETTDFNPFLTEFTGKATLVEKIEEIRNNSSNIASFERRFFQWFNGFKALKFIHFLRDNYFPPAALSQEVPKLLEQANLKENPNYPFDALELLRTMERNEKKWF